MFKFRTVYRYGLITLINNVNMSNIANVPDLSYSFNVLNTVNRDKRGLHLYSMIINTIAPNIWLNYLEDEFLCIYIIYNLSKHKYLN